MLFSHVKISSFCTKAHLVFHWCLYNKVTIINEVSMENNWNTQINWLLINDTLFRHNSKQDLG